MSSSGLTGLLQHTEDGEAMMNLHHTKNAPDSIRRMVGPDKFVVQELSFSAKEVYVYYTYSD